MYVCIEDRKPLKTVVSESTVIVDRPIRTIESDIDGQHREVTPNDSFKFIVII